MSVIQFERKPFKHLGCINLVKIAVIIRGENKMKKARIATCVLLLLMLSSGMMNE